MLPAACLSTSVPASAQVATLTKTVTMGDHTCHPHRSDLLEPRTVKSCRMTSSTTSSSAARMACRLPGRSPAVGIVPRLVRFRSHPESERKRRCRRGRTRCRSRRRCVRPPRSPRDIFSSESPAASRASPTVSEVLLLDHQPTPEGVDRKDALADGNAADRAMPTHPSHAEQAVPQVNQLLRLQGPVLEGFQHLSPHLAIPRMAVVVSNHVRGHHAPSSANDPKIDLGIEARQQNVEVPSVRGRGRLGRDPPEDQPAQPGPRRQARPPGSEAPVKRREPDEGPFIERSTPPRGVQAGGPNADAAQGLRSAPTSPAPTAPRLRGPTTGPGNCASGPPCRREGEHQPVRRHSTASDASPHAADCGSAPRLVTRVQDILELERGRPGVQHRRQ